MLTSEISAKRNDSQEAPHFQRISGDGVWNPACPLPGVLRITATTTNKVVLKIEGRLVGPWVDELKETVQRKDGWRQPLEIDVAGLTYVDKGGEKVLSWLHKMGARFQGEAPFSAYLFGLLKIPLHSRGTALDKGDIETQR